MDTAPSYTIAGIAPHHELVEAWSTARLPFEPKGWLRDFRDGLAQAVRGLGPSAGQTLHAEYISESRDLCDAENVLFCNVGSGCFAAAASDGLRFERAYNPIPPSPSGIHAAHYYRYRMSPPRADFAHWRRGRTQARWDGAVFDSLGELRLPALVWARIAESSIELDGEMSDGQAFGLSVTVRHPEGRGLNLTNLVKTVFDGAIASFHAHSGPIADQVRASLATTLQIAPSEVDARLLDQQRAILGARRLVWPFGRDGIQWNPADDRCLAGELLSVRTDRGEWRLSGALFELKPASV